MSSIAVTEKILSYVEEHLDSALTLEETAKALHYSKFYIARVFKEHTGITLHQYIRGRRLSEAAGKLVKSRKPVIEIALEAGYGSQQAFMQAFHQEYECTPQEYRKKGLFAPKQNRIVLQEEKALDGMLLISGLYLIIPFTQGLMSGINMKLLLTG